MSMSIEINKPYSSLKTYDVSFDCTSIRLNESEIKNLFEQLDNELHYDETREDLIKKIEDLEEKVIVLENEVEGLTDRNA